MNYIIEPEIISFVFLFIFTVSFFITKRLKTIKNNVYGLFLIIALLTILFDITSVVLYESHRINIETLYFFNICFYAFQAILAMLLFVYTLIITNKLFTVKLWIMLVFSLPGLVLLVLSVTTPMTSLVFYFDENGIYSQGLLHKYSYITLAFYVISSLIILIIYKKEITKGSFNAFLCYFVIVSICAIIQLFNPMILLVHVATALGLTIFYLSMQSPTVYIDKMTGTFNNYAIEEMLAFSIKMKKDFSIVALSLGNYNNINATYGIATGNEILINIAKYLKKEFGQNNVVRYRGTHFACVIKDKLISYTELQDIKNSFPKKWFYNNIDIPINIKMAGVNSNSLIKENNFLSLFDYYLDDPKFEYDANALLVDDYYLKEIDYTFQVQNALAMAIENRGIEIHIQPIINLNTGKIASGEVLARLTHPVLGHISPSVFIPISEQSGLINQLGYLIFEKTCSFLSTHDITKYGLDRLEVNLSVSQCMQSNLSEKIMKTLQKYNVSPSLIRFEITESAASTSMTALNDTMNELKALGFTFALDDFGTGYSNLSYVMRLPFEHIKLDKGLLWSCFHDEKARYLFDIICSACTSIGLKVICEGAENEKHIEFLKERNVSLVQGFYYSKPMSTAEFYDYIVKKSN